MSSRNGRSKPACFQGENRRPGIAVHFHTFCGSPVQAMDTQFNALPTLPVLARTVSGCLDSAFLGLELNRSVVGKTAISLVSHALNNSRPTPAGARPGSAPPLNQGRPPC